jgi:hypothetical protein
MQCVWWRFTSTWHMDNIDAVRFDRRRLVTGAEAVMTLYREGRLCEGLRLCQSDRSREQLADRLDGVRDVLRRDVKVGHRAQSATVP